MPGGYGKTFRLSNMGDAIDASIAELLRALDDVIAHTPQAAG